MMNDFFSLGRAFPLSLGRPRSCSTQRSAEGEDRGEGAPHRRPAWVWALLFAILCAGCGSRAPLSTSTLIVSTNPASQALDAKSIFPLEAGNAQFLLTSDDHTAGTPITIRREPTSAHGAVISVSEDDSRVEFLARTESGEIALTAVIDHKEKVLTLFDPPLIIAPMALTPGETFHSEASMRVVDVNNPQKQRERGKAKRSITYTADAVIRTPRGETSVAQIDIHFTADLRLADAEEQTTLYISREEGLIASDSREKVTILGAFPRETQRVLVRQ